MKNAARGNQPWYVKGVGAEVVGVRDAARALVLAGDKGVPGERYIVSDRFMEMRQILEVAAEAAGTPPPRYAVPVTALSAGGIIGEQLARMLRKDLRLTRTSIRLMHIMTALDHSKSTRELGWEPRPIEEALREAVEFFTTRRPSQ